MTSVDFKQKMIDLHAETYSLTNDIEKTHDKAFDVVYKLLVSQGYNEGALIYEGIVNEYQQQMKGRVA